MTSYICGSYQVFINYNVTFRITIISPNNKIYKIDIDEDLNKMFSDKNIIIEECSNKLIIKSNSRKIYIPEIINEYDFRDIQIAEMRKMIIDMNKKIEMLEKKINNNSEPLENKINNNFELLEKKINNNSKLLEKNELSLLEKYNIYQDKLNNNSSDTIKLCIFDNSDINYEEYGITFSAHNYFLPCHKLHKNCLCNNRNLKILHITKYESLLINCDKNIKHNVKLGTMPIDNTDNNDFYYYLTKYNKYFDKLGVSNDIKNAGIQFLENLEELYINIPFEGFSLNLLSDMKKLKKLSFCFCILENIENILILNNLEALEELSFKYIQNNFTLDLFINKCKLHKLKKIEIIGCSNIKIKNPKLYSDKGITLVTQ